MRWHERKFFFTSRRVGMTKDVPVWAEGKDYDDVDVDEMTQTNRDSRKSDGSASSSFPQSRSPFQSQFQDQRRNCGKEEEQSAKESRMASPGRRDSTSCQL